MSSELARLIELELETNLRFATAEGDEKLIKDIQRKQAEARRMTVQAVAKHELTKQSKKDMTAAAKKRENTKYTQAREKKEQKKKQKQLQEAARKAQKEEKKKAKQAKQAKKATTNKSNKNVSSDKVQLGRLANRQQILADRAAQQAIAIQHFNRIKATQTKKEHQRILRNRKISRAAHVGIQVPQDEPLADEVLMRSMSIMQSQFYHVPGLDLIGSFQDTLLEFTDASNTNRYVPFLSLGTPRFSPEVRIYISFLPHFFSNLHYWHCGRLRHCKGLGLNFHFIAPEAGERSDVGHWVMSTTLRTPGKTGDAFMY